MNNPQVFLKNCSQKFPKIQRKAAPVPESQCVKNACIRSFSGPNFSTFGLSTEIYQVNLCIQSEFGEIQIRKTQNTDSFHAVSF